MARPSSHTSPSPAPGDWNSDAKPCSVGVLSWWGDTGAVHVRPSSLENVRRRSYASLPPAAFDCSQCAASDPSASLTTEGTSAQFTNQSSPDATVRAGDQPDAVRSANFNATVAPPVRSTQLRSSRSPCALNCGWPL